MRYWVKDVFEQFDFVCRSIFKAAEEEEAKLLPQSNRSTPHSEFDPVGGEGPDDNSYADHVARGMAKIRARR